MIKTTCPNCGHEYDLDEEISKEINKKDDENNLLRKQLEELKDSSEKKKLEFRQELEDEIKNEMENKLKEKITDELNRSFNEKEQKHSEENNLLRRQLEAVKNDAEKMETALRQKLECEIKNEIEGKLKEKITDELNRSFNEKEQKYTDEIKAFEFQISKMKDAARKASNVADGTSNDIKGKIGEFNLEILIRNLFPNDIIEKIGSKGGGDFIQTVIEENHKCGKILYECKNAERFNRTEWIPKIREDSLRDNCDRYVIVTKVMPVGKDEKGNDIRTDKVDPCRIDGVWICTFSTVSGVISLLRDGIVHQDIANVSQFDRSNKKEDLYEYVTSNEFMNEGDRFRDKLIKRRENLEDYLKRTVRSIKIQIDETSDLITKFDNMFSRIGDITGKCADTEILDEVDDEFLKSIIDSKGSKKKVVDKGQFTMDSF